MVLGRECHSAKEYIAHRLFKSIEELEKTLDEVLLPPPPPEAIKPNHRTDVTFLDSEGEEFKPAMGAVLLPNGMVEFVDYNPAEVFRDMYAAADCNRLSNE